MSNIKLQEERLDYLVEEFKADSGEYKDLNTPDNSEEKTREIVCLHKRLNQEFSSSDENGHRDRRRRRWRQKTI